MSKHDWIRQVSSPLTEEMLRPLADHTAVIQFMAPLTEDEYTRLARVMAGHPSVTLRIYEDREGRFHDLDFLRHFKGLRRFQFDLLWGLRDLSGLENLAPELELLSIGYLHGFRPALGFLHWFPRLRSLRLERHTREIEAVAELSELRELTLRSITLPDLALLKPLTRLLSLDLKLGGTRDLRHLPEIGRLRYFEAWMIRGLDDISSLAGVTTLQYLFLQTLKHVTALPEMNRLGALRRVHLETMSGIRDLGPLARAPALEQLALVEMPRLGPRDLQCLVGHPTLREVIAGFGSARKNRAAEELLPAARARWTESFEYR